MKRTLMTFAFFLALVSDAFAYTHECNVKEMPSLSFSVKTDAPVKVEVEFNAGGVMGNRTQDITKNVEVLSFGGSDIVEVNWIKNGKSVPYLFINSQSGVWFMLDKDGELKREFELDCRAD